jgi:hypothetical protein
MPMVSSDAGCGGERYMDNELTESNGLNRLLLRVFGLWGVVVIVSALGLFAYAVWQYWPRDESNAVSDEIATELVDFERLAVEIGSIDGAPPKGQRVTLECDPSSDGSYPSASVSFTFGPSDDPEDFYGKALAAAGYIEVDGIGIASVDATEKQFRRPADLTLVWLSIRRGDASATLSAQPAVAQC